jgi:RNA polymerase sigma-70 factor (ECF subfamily)
MMFQDMTIAPSSVSMDGRHARMQVQPMCVTGPKDEILLQQIGEGDKAAFAMLLERHVARVRSLARSMLGSRSEAQDVVQDVFLKIWARPALWQPGRARFSTWLHRVTANACIDRLRSRSISSPEAVEVLAGQGSGPETSVFERQRARRVHDALMRLPPRQRLALTLCHYQGHTNGETAAIMETSIEAVESLLSRARRQLRAILADDMKILLDEA